MYIITVIYHLSRLSQEEPNTIINLQDVKESGVTTMQFAVNLTISSVINSLTSVNICIRTAVGKGLTLLPPSSILKQILVICATVVTVICLLLLFTERI